MIDFWANLVGSTTHWIWLSVAVLLAIAELLVPGVLLIWIAGAAALVGVAALLTGMALSGQLALFAVLCVGLTYAGRRKYRDQPVPSEDPLLNDRSARLIGGFAEIVEEVDAHKGRARVGDSVWPARGPNLPVGSVAMIVSVRDGAVHLSSATPAKQLDQGDLSPAAITADDPENE